MCRLCLSSHLFLQISWSLVSLLQAHRRSREWGKQRREKSNWLVILDFFKGKGNPIGSVWSWILSSTLSSPCYRARCLFLFNFDPKVLWHWYLLFLPATHNPLFFPSGFVFSFITFPHWLTGYSCMFVGSMAEWWALFLTNNPLHFHSHTPESCLALIWTVFSPLPLLLSVSHCVSRPFYW